MVPTYRSLFFALVGLLASLAPARSADEPSARVSKEYLTIVKVETRYLVRAVERLQETIIEELGGRIRIKNAMPGTIVKVVLPLHRREPLPAIEPPKSENVRVQGA